MRGISWVVPMRRNRDFMWLWSGQAASELGSSMSTLVFPLVGYAISGSTRAAGLATAGVLVGSLVASLPAGVVVDRSSRRRVLLLANLAGAASFGVLALLALTDTLTIASMVALGVVSGAAEAFVGPANGAAIRAVVPREELPEALAQSQARHHAAELAGPPVGGALYSLARPLPFVVDALSFVVAALAVNRVRHPLPAPEQPAERVPMGRSLLEGLRFLWASPVMRAMMSWAALNNLASMYLTVVITLRLVQAGVAPVAIGTISTIAAVAGLAGAVLAPTIVRRAPTGWMTVVTGLVAAAALLGTAFTTNVVLIGLWYGASALLFPATNSGISGYSTAIVPERLQGRMFSAAGLVANGATPLAPLIAGLLLAEVSGTVATIVGVVVLALAVVPILGTRETRTLGRPSEWPVPTTA
ncbi:MAG: transporter [Marmoricola sp.]|nr:transporter [Marmoricola sp.]